MPLHLSFHELFFEKNSDYSEGLDKGVSMSYICRPKIFDFRS